MFVGFHFGIAELGKFQQCFVASRPIGRRHRKQSLDFIAAEKAVTHAVERTANTINEIQRKFHIVRNSCNPHQVFAGGSDQGIKN